MMWGKKLISCIMAIVVVMTMFFSAPGLKMKAAGTEVSYAVTGGNITFDTSTGTITDCDESVTEAVIPNTIEGVSVTGIGKNAFSFCYDLSSIVIPTSVTYIGSGAFALCYSLRRITIPASVTSLENYIFSACINLTRINVDNNNTVYSSADGVLFNKNQTTLICYPIGKVQTTYDIPSSVTKIEKSAFCLCDSLSNIEIPASVTTIESSAFLRCDSLSSINVDINNTTYSSIDGVCFNKDQTTLVCYPAGKVQTEYDIPESVTNIGDNAFAWCDLSNIEISSNVNSIGDSAFAHCSGLSNIEIPASVTSLGDSAFENSYDLNSIEISPNVTRLGDSVFRDCSNLSSIEIPTSVTSIGDFSFRGCSNLSSIEIPTSVTSIGDFSFENCYGLTDVYYGGSEKDWNNIIIGSNNEDLRNATIHFNSTSPGDTDTSIPQAKKYTDVKGVLSQSGSGTGSVYLTYDETKLSEASNVYNHQLARFSIGLSTMAYSTDSKMRDVLEKLDYKNIQSVKDEQPLEYATSPYWICHKKVMLDGKETELLLVVIRGTYHEEWLDNFDSGTEDTHVGFQRAANFVINGMYNYVKDSKNKVDQNADLKILVTGHSRGAATANLVGKTLDGGNTLYNMDFNANDVFVYTYATPNVTRLSERNNPKYNNIFNIVNPEDFVTKVLPSDWGYGRYGITYVLPSKTTDIMETGNYVDYASYLVNLQGHFMALRPDDTKGYIPYPDGMANVSSYIKNVTNVVKNTKQYYEKSLGKYVKGEYDEPGDSLHNLYKFGLGGYCSTNQKYKDFSYKVMATALGGGWGLTGLETIKFFGWNQGINQYFSCAHYADTYYSAMRCLTKEQLTDVHRGMLMGIVNCPVDVTITDEEGNVVGQIINNEVDESIENKISMSVEGDSKIFYLPEDVPFNITLTGNDDGIMDYSLCEYNPDTGETGRVYYQDVPVENNVSMTQEIKTDDTIDTIMLKAQTGDVIPTTKIMNNAEIGALSVDVTIEGVGSANSLSNLTEGDYVTVSASTDENNEFLGWYDEAGELMTKENEYSFSIHENRRFTAKFTNVIVDTEGIQFENPNINMAVDEYVLNDAFVLPSNATDKNIYYSSSDNTVVSVDEMGILHALKKGTAIITAENSDGIFSAQCKVTVGEKEKPLENVTEEDKNPSIGQNNPSEFINSGNVVDGNNTINIANIRLYALSNKIAAGKRIKLTADIFPVNASNQRLIWSSSNPKVATVNQSGVVTMKKKTGGKSVIITAESVDGSGAKAVFRIKSMKGVVKKVTITGAKKRTLKAGKKLKLNAKVTATKGANKKLLWMSNNTKYATVSATGKIKTKKLGKGKKVKITAMATDGSNKKMTVTIKMR